MTTGLICLAAVLLLAMLRVPLGISLLTVSIGGITAINSFDVARTMIPMTLSEAAFSYELAVVPLFILMGNVLSRTGISQDLFRAANAFLGSVRGGLALATMVTCAGFSAVCGSSFATAATMAKVAYPSMLQYGYSKRLASATIAAGGTLGILIPPSIVMVMYSVATNTSVGALFMAGVIPGIALASMLGGMTWYRARKFNYPRQPKASWRQRLSAFRESAWGLMLIIVVMGGIYSGMFTPTEAAAMSAVYAFVVAVFIYKDIGLKDVPKILLNSANMSAMLLYIITNAVMFSFILANENIPQQLTTFMIEMGFGKIAFLLAVNVILLMAGNFMEPSSIMLIFAPIVFPIAMQLGIDPIHLGVMMVVNMEVGMCHPPVGLNLYVASGLTKMGITELTVAVWPWLLTMLVFLVMATYWPAMSLWLPRTLGMM